MVVMDWSKSSGNIVSTAWVQSFANDVLQNSRISSDGVMVLISTDWTPALPPGKNGLEALCKPLAVYRPRPWPEGRPASILNCTDRSVPLGSHWGHSLAHLQRLTPEVLMLYLGQTSQDKATSLHLFSPFAPSRLPKLASCPSAKLSPLGVGRKQLTPVLICWNSLRDQGEGPEGGKMA